MDKPTDDTILERLLGPADPELLCDEGCKKLDQYVDLELQGAAADDHVPGMRATFKAAPPARRSTRASCARGAGRARSQD